MSHRLGPMIATMVAGLLLPGCRGTEAPSGPAPAPTSSPPRPVETDPSPAPAPATDPHAPRGFWAIWAEPGRTFVLYDQISKPAAPNTLEIRVDKVEIIEDVTVSFLEWTHVRDGKRERADAVFGAILLDGEHARIMWDTDRPEVEYLSEWLHRPMPYTGKPAPGEEMVERVGPSADSSDVACLARDETVEDQLCDDTCYGYACFSAAGVVKLDGLLAPEWGIYGQDPPRE